MRRVFADASYWVALLNPDDQLYPRATAQESRLKRARLITTEFVLAEFLNFYAPRGPLFRAASEQLAARILEDPQIEVTSSDRTLFRSGLTLYAARPDKGYSLTDCVSMVVMREGGIREVLTQDRHFRQEGFLPLLENAI